MQDLSQKRNYAPYLYLTQWADGAYHLYMLVSAEGGEQVEFGGAPEIREVMYPGMPGVAKKAAVFKMVVKKADPGVPPLDYADFRQIGNQEAVFEVIAEVENEITGLTARTSIFCEDADTGFVEQVIDQKAYHCPYLFFSEPVDSTADGPAGEIRYRILSEGYEEHGWIDEFEGGYQWTRYVFLIKSDASNADLPDSPDLTMPLEAPFTRPFSNAAVKRPATPKSGGMMSDLVPPAEEHDTDVLEPDAQQQIEDFSVKTYLSESEEDVVARRALLGKEPTSAEQVFERAAGPGKKSYKGRSKSKASNSR
jgi:hypothetical protein